MKKWPQHKIVWLLAGISWLFWLCYQITQREASWIFQDSAFTLFRMLQGESIIYDRYSQWLVLIIPQTIAWLKLDFHWVLIAAASSLSILGLVLWWIFKGFVNETGENLWWIFLLLPWIGGAFYQFHGFNETKLAWLMLWSMMVVSHANLHVFIKIFFAWLALFAHPMAWILLPPLWILYQSSSPVRLRAKVLEVFAIVALPVAKLIFLDINSYESSLIGGSINIWMNELWKGYTMQYMGNALNGWLFPYALIWLLVPFIWAIKIKKIGFSAEDQKSKVLVWLLPYSLAILFAVMWMYKLGDSAFNMQRNFSILPFFIVFILWSIIPLNGVKLLSYLLIIFSLGQLFFVSFPQKREIKLTNWVKLMHKNKNCVKAIGGEKEDQEWGALWALPYETLLESTKLKGRGTFTAWYVGKDTFKVAEKGKMMGADFWYPQKIHQLNPRYFHLDSTCNYDKWMVVGSND